jgi:hypothetical protein
MSLSSVECTVAVYATEQYSESRPAVGTKTDKGDTALQRRLRDFAPVHTSGARFFKRRSPDFLQIYLSAGNSPPD